MLPDVLKRKATLQARELGISFGEFVRKAIESMLHSRKTTRGSDPLFSNFRPYEGNAPSDSSVDHDKYLYDEEP